MERRRERAHDDALEHLDIDDGLDYLLRQPRERLDDGALRRIDGVLVGVLVGFRDGQEPLVTYPGQPGSAALVARTAVDVAPEHVGQEIVLAFEDGDPRRPLITGRIRTPAPWPPGDRPQQVDVEADGCRLTLTVTQQLVLRCGKASITLTADGRIAIDGAYVSTRSTGVLRIKGGSVQIN